VWGVPFGVGLALFADDLVHALGPRWYGAAGVIRAFGLIAAAAHVGFNWHAFYRARGDTRPLAVVAVLLMVVFLAVAVPLTYSDHLNGFAWGMAIVAGAPRGALVLPAQAVRRLRDGPARRAGDRADDPRGRRRAARAAGRGPLGARRARALRGGHGGRYVAARA
jgi:hypothetical protein